MDRVGQEKVYETLAALGVEFDYEEHPAAPTIEIAKQYWKNLDSTHFTSSTVICFSGIIREIAIIW